jgi:hypothetical protein
VAGKRESLGIRIFAPQRILWSKREIEVLGKRPRFSRGSDVGSNAVCGTTETTLAWDRTMLGKTPSVDARRRRNVGHSTRCCIGATIESDGAFRENATIGKDKRSVHQDAKTVERTGTSYAGSNARWRSCPSHWAISGLSSEQACSAWNQALCAA